ncbi:hypothetical protein ACHQM5_022143 [Ranunculus cassubicifolius]
MDFDEYDYLEKAVEEPEIRNNGGSSGKKDGEERRSSRNRRGDDEDDEIKGEERKSSRHRRGEEDEDEGRSKKLRVAEGENNGEEKSSRSDRRDKDRHRSSRDVERDSDRDRDRERYRDRGGRDRGAEREREREKERSGREKDREREKVREKDRGDDKERVREKDRDGERERERSRRSSSHSRRHRSSVDRDVDAEIVRAKSREREARERSRDREMREREQEMERERESRRFKDKKEAQEPEADPERDQRTVFAYQMPLKATERDVYEFFSKAGKVRDVRLIMDRNSRRSKGVGYVEFYDAMSVPMAIALSGHNLMGQPVMVKPSEAEKNLVQSTVAGGGAGVLSGPYGAVARKLYVGNLHFNMTEDQLRAVFEPFGPVELVQLPLDLESGLCKGFGFVQFAQLEHAKAAQSLNGKLEIAGRVIKVSAVTDHIGVQNAGANAADFDDEDGGGLSLNAQSRAMLMQKLDRTGIATSIVGSLGVPVLNGPGPTQLPVGQGMGFPGSVAAPAFPFAPPVAEIPVGTPSLCLLLMNMFDPAAENEPEFDLDIKEEVQEECSKYGPVKHIHVDKESAGHVYLRFESVGASAAAQRSMHMRWFAGRRIVAVFMEPRDYENKFPGS